MNNRNPVRVTLSGKQKRQTPSALRTINIETGRFDNVSQSQFQPSRNNLISPQMVPPPDVGNLPGLVMQPNMNQQQQFRGPQVPQQQFMGSQQQFLGQQPPQQQFLGRQPPRQQFLGPQSTQQQFLGPQPPFMSHEAPPVHHPFLQGVAGIPAESHHVGPTNVHQFDATHPFPPPELHHVIPPNMHQFDVGPPQRPFLPEPHHIRQPNIHQFDGRPPQHPFPPEQLHHRNPTPPQGPKFNVLSSHPFPQDAAVPKPSQVNVLPAAQEHPKGHPLRGQPLPQESVPLQQFNLPQQTGPNQTVYAEEPIGLPRVSGVPKSSVNLHSLTLYPHTVQPFISRGGLKNNENKYQWNKVTVHNFPADDVKNIERALNQLYKPKTVATFMHWVEEDRLCFLLMNSDCKKLLRAGLKLPTLDNRLIELTMTLSYSNVQINQMIRSLLVKRFDETKRHLDLSYVVFEPEVKRIFYDIDEHVCGWQMLIEEGAKMVKELVTLSLAKNGLHGQVFENILGVIKTFQSLKALDLSDNEILALPAKKLQIHNVTDVTLTGNPFCKTYTDHDSYISALRQIFPSVTKLDGTFLSPDLPLWRQVYIATGTAGDARLLADQFVDHFFGLYDGNRKNLRGLYHEDAVFSLSSSYLPGQSTSSSARLSAYAVESRNLLKLSDLSKAGHALYQGAEEVLSILCRLPESEHDLFSFTVDVMRHTVHASVVTVTGVFCEPTRFSTRYFVRTFVLLRMANEEYQVANDQLYVTNASTRQAKEAFRHKRVPLSRPPRELPPPPQLSDCDKLQMSKILAQLTEMNEVWSYKCLNESQWDIKEALVVFSELLKLDQIPEAAFRKVEGNPPQFVAETKR